MRMVLSGIADSTNFTYAPRQRYFYQYYFNNSVCWLPASEETLLNFCSDLHASLVSASTISGYLSAIRHFHLINGFEDPTEGRHRLALFKRGVSVNTAPPVPRAPVTDSNLFAFLSYLDLSNFKDLTIYAMVTTAFFAFLRISELTYPDKTGFSPSSCLTSGDLTWYSDRVLLFLKHSKTDKKRLGVSIIIGRSPTEVCAYKALSLYLTERGRLLPSLDPISSALFVFPDGSPMTKSFFVSELCRLSDQVGVVGKVSSHSLRIGAATSAWRAGFSDSQIMRLGRWKSNSFMRYIRDDEDSLTALNSSLGAMWRLNVI